MTQGQSRAGLVREGASILISRFVSRGDGPKRVMILVLGRSLAACPVARRHG